MADLKRLLKVVDTCHNRNWDWLLDWVDGSDHVTADASVSDVVELYENEDQWKYYHD